jgi:hypothetical protein
VLVDGTAYLSTVDNYLFDMTETEGEPGDYVGLNEGGKINRDAPNPYGQVDLDE